MNIYIIYLKQLIASIKKEAKENSERMCAEAMYKFLTTINAMVHRSEYEYID